MWLLADGREIWIMDVLDDHSRVLIAARVCHQATGPAAWDAFAHGVDEWGLPAHVLSDNGSCFTGRLFSGGEVDFERTLRAFGIRQINSSPAHPQTCGKLERSHSTTKRWLALHDLAEDESELQQQLDEWRRFYNYERPHRSLKGATPFERWSANPPAQPAHPIREPADAQLRRVGPTGVASWKHYTLAIGTEWAGDNVLIIARDRHNVTVHGANGLKRDIVIDPSHRYQRSGRPTGGKRKRPQ